jgi:polyisoprenoid-binding protein YceI
MVRARQLVLLLLFAVGTTAAFGQNTTFQLDAARSTVEFTLGDVMHTVHGKFRVKDSSVQFDQKTGTATGALVVDATSGDSGNGSRDKKMNKDILESAKYPEFRFTVQRVQGNVPANGTAELTLIGIMSVHGGDHPMTVSAPVTIDNGVASSDVHFVIPYVAWGMKDPSTFILRVEKKVEIVVHAVGKMQSSS